MGGTQVAFDVRTAAIAITSLAAFGALLFVAQRAIDAADHFDPPTLTDPNVDPLPDAAADIADIYAFYTDTDLVLALTFSGPQATGLPATYDRDVLYRLNVSNDGDPRTTEFPIEFRFGHDGTSAGFSVTGLPDGVTIVGPVETDLEKDGILVRAGLFDDPFFFDSQGLRETRQTGTLSFDNQRDFFSQKNITAVVVQIPRAVIQSGNRQIDVWSETARFGGQLE